MGIYFTDKFSLLHFASGIIAYYWNFSLIGWFIFHLLYEILENLPNVYKFIDIIPLWPGGKKYPDSIINRVGDQVYSMTGWIFTHYYIKYLYGSYP
jgi:hypothetical protein